MSDEIAAVGWDAIDQALAQVYGEQEPKHYGTLIPYSLGGQDPLDGISVYKVKHPFHIGILLHMASRNYMKRNLKTRTIVDMDLN